MKQGLSMDELVAELMRQNAAKEDYVVLSRYMQMDVCDSMPYLRVMDDALEDRIEPMEISGNAHRQLSSRLGIPIKYYNRMLSECPSLLAKNVNHWFQHNAEQRMLRIMDGKVRAFLSNRYLRLDHHEVTCAIMPILGEVSGIQFVSNQITENHLYVKAVNPQLQLELAPGRRIQAGLAISNSETGLGTFSVSSMLYFPDLECGMIADSGATRRTHSGPIYRAEENFLLRPERFLTSDDNTLLEDIRLSVRNAMEETCFTQTVEQMRNAVELRFDAENTPAVVSNAGNMYGITETEQAGVLQQLGTQDDLSLYTLAGAVNS